MAHIQLILIHCIWHMTGKKKSGFFTFKVHIWQPHTVARQCSVDNVHITLSKLVEHAMVPWHGMHFQTHLHGEHNSKLEGMYTLGDVNWHQLPKSCMHFIGLYCNPVCLTLDLFNQKSVCCDALSRTTIVPDFKFRSGVHTHASQFHHRDANFCKSKILMTTC